MDAAKGRTCFESGARSLVTILGVALLFSTLAQGETAADVYKRKCSACHGPTGAGDTMLGKNLKVRPLFSEPVQAQSDDTLFAIINKGKNKMPAFESKLSKDQIHELVKYVRALKK